MATAKADDQLLRSVAAAEAAGSLAATAAAQIRRWLAEAPFATYREALAADIRAGNWRALDDAFYAVLEFGTGGRRGKMYPVGTNVLNSRTMAESARGLADFVTAQKGADAPRSCAIAHDTRHHSRRFAALCAGVLASYGFKVYITPGPRSTPLLSYAVRRLGCDCGIMITASHNPPADNGFKCYNDRGAQVVPPDDEAIIRAVRAASELEIDVTPFDRGLEDGSIVLMGPEIDAGYLENVVAQSVSPARDVGIVYTPMHGVGETSVAAALALAGFSRVDVLASQKVMDGSFPTVPGHVANPEIPKTLDLAIERAKELGYDLVIASDPDADRIGVALPVTGDPAGDWTTLDGNQIGVAIAAFVLRRLGEAGRLRPGDYLVTTLVSSQMVRPLALGLGVGVEDDLLVGFKWIAQRIDAKGPDGFLFGFEESHGYQRGSYVRDKDAAAGALLFAELAAASKAQGRTALDFLDDLYVEVGHYGERLVNVVLEGREGAAQIGRLMRAFREDPPAAMGGLKLVEVLDYQEHEVRPIGGAGEARPLPEPSGDLLIFQTEADGTRFAARPSGTEPKIKFYLFARTPVDGGRDGLAAARAATKVRLDHIEADLRAYVQQVVSAGA